LFLSIRYIYGGSHGCVNLPLKVAKNVYEHAVIGMPVFVILMKVRWYKNRDYFI